MKVRHFQEQLSPALNHSSALLVGLRHGKIMINTLLRWCSAGVLSSYLLFVTIGIHFYNQLTQTSGWVPNLLLVLFILLFTCLLYVQYRYSEKVTENLPFSENDMKLNSFYVRDHYKTYQRLIGSYVVANFVSWLAMACIRFPHQQIVTGLFIISGLAFYIFGLFIIRGLLKEKWAIRVMINQFGHH